MMELKKALVTGGLGLIGSHLVEALIKQGIKVKVLDRQTAPLPKIFEALRVSGNLEVISGDIVDSNLVNKSMEDTDYCFHLAASLGVLKILKDPIESYRTNILGSENVISSASKHGIRLFLASTSEIYGKNAQQPLNENSDRVLGSPQNIRWSYSEAKALDESLAEMYAIEHGLRYVIGRFFNTVGPRQSGEYGMVLPRFVGAAIRDEDILVYGDGKQTRTFCHVLDAVEAIILLAQEEKSLGQVFNIGGHGEMSINELAQKVITETKSKSKIRRVSYATAYPRGFEETFRRVPDTSKLKSFTGWSPTRTIENIIQDIENHLRAL
jgi:UDP-glucose 4-epimerase